MNRKAIISALFAVGATASALAGPFTAGDLVVYRVGDGTSGLINTGNAVFLDEYTTGGTLVQSISTGIFASGTATSEGLITLSADGQNLGVTGYISTAATSLAGTTSAAVNRSIQIYGGNGTQAVPQTNLSDWASANNPRSVYTDGTNLWLGGAAGGVSYNTTTPGATVSLSTGITNVRQVNAFGGQLYFSTSSGIFSQGTGLPTSASAPVSMGIPTTGSPYSFFFAKLNAASSSFDTAYVADDGATTGGIQKYSFVGSAWVASGTVTASGVRGLTGTVTANGVQLFGTTGGNSATGGGTLYGFTDTTGYNSAISGSAAALATANLSGNGKESFRGVAFVPQAVPEPASLAVVGIGLAAIRRRRARK